ncbi:hypothetical protein GCM10010964_42300 [Caldovatus sediminis]|uniref:Uncharacterized protein n=1 Tax=Caldovatus sediminis TaxID=2041189 RepID=A0A8J2ZF49_9PROT|nr:hypothetical protein [Caldovatus sediminis]GGG50576.1 hypothetical protein GCM10010964_42300 [Caldovatus sediminis]
MLSARPPIPEVDLAAAVIHRAIEDALTPDDRLARPRVIATPTGPHRGFTVGLKPREREEAVRFLLDTAPGWAGAREAWCDAAGVDPDAIRRHVLRHIAPGSIPADIRRALRLPVLATAVAAEPRSLPAVPAPVQAVAPMAEAA